MELGTFGCSLCRVSKNATYVNTRNTSISRLCDWKYNPISGAQYKKEPHLMDYNFIRRHIWNPIIGAQYKGHYDVEGLCIKHKKVKFKMNNLKHEMLKARPYNEVGDY